MMIDWITRNCNHSAKHPPLWDGVGSRIIRTDRFGEIEYERNARETIEHPSHSSTMSLKFHESGTGIQIAGNPAKFLQGHNLWGTSSLQSLITDVHDLLAEQIQELPLGLFWHAYDFEENVSRLDLTRSIRFGSQEEARQFMSILEYTGHSRHKGRSKAYDNLLSVGTVYFGKHSRRWSLKVYLKLEEFERHWTGERDGTYDHLRDWCAGIVRFELCLRGPEVSRILYEDGYRINHCQLLEAWTRYFNRITWSHMDLPIEQVIEKVRPKLKLVVSAWVDGRDLKQWLPHRTFYDYRRQLLEHGIDIAVPYQSTEEEEKPSLFEIPADDPRWDPEPLDVNVNC